MTFKKIFAFTLALLLIIGSALSVSAETPPYSESFESEEEMLTALSEYAAEYPDYGGFNFNSNIPNGYHFEYRQVLSIKIDSDELVPMEYSFLESMYGYGVDMTYTSYNARSYPYYLSTRVYYGYNSDEVLEALEEAKPTMEPYSTYDEGTINGCSYVIYSEPEGVLPQSGYYYIAVDDYLVYISVCSPASADFLDRISVEYTDIYIPVKIKDNADWFDKTVADGYVIGDANADNVLNIRDATALQKYCANMGEVDKLVADFNGDLKINVKDATDIQKKLAGLSYTCRSELYPVSFMYRNKTDLKLIESTMDNPGPLSANALIQNYDTPEIERYTTVFNSVQEFEAFFGKTLDKYDEEFFEENSLVYLYRWYISSSFNYVPDGLAYSDGVLYISAYSDMRDGDVMQCAFGNYNIFFEVNKTDIEGIKGIVVSEYTIAYD